MGRQRGGAPTPIQVLPQGRSGLGAAHRSAALEAVGGQVVGDAHGDQEDIGDGAVPHGSVHRGQPLVGSGRKAPRGAGLLQEDQQRLPAPQHLLDVLQQRR